MTNRKALHTLKYPLISICMLFTLSTQLQTATPQTFPWSGTFNGVNGQAIPIVTQPTPPAANPYQAPSTVSQTKTTLTNPLQNQPSSSTTKTSGSTTSTTPTPVTTVKNLLSNPLVPLNQKTNAVLTTNTTAGGTSLKVTPKTKYRTTAAANAMTSMKGFSFTQVQNPLQAPQQNLFPGNSGLQTAYNNFMGALAQTPSFLPLFKKIHITALSEIYMYLTGIYSSLNMTHIDDLKTYMIAENQFCLNKKTLIINNLLDVVMAQLNQALQSLIPGLPESNAISSGMSCLKSDKISTMNMMILDMEKSVLATLGLASFDPSQTMAAYNALVKYVPLLNIANSADLQAGTAVLASSNFSSNSLTPSQSKAVANALSTIVTYLQQQQSTGEVQTVITALQGGANTTPLTTDQVTFLNKFIGQCVFAEPLNEEITLCQTFNSMFSQNPVSSTPLTTDQYNCLQGIIAFILQQYESNSITQLEKMIQSLGATNTELEVLPPSQWVKLQLIAKEMLTPTNPLLLKNLTSDERALMAYGLWVLGTQKNSLTSTQQYDLQTMSLVLKQRGMDTSTLTGTQPASFQTALALFNAYQFSPITMPQFNSQMASLMSGIPGQQSNDPQVALQGLLANLSLSTFSNYSLSQQQAIMQIFQLVNQIFESRYLQHIQQSSVIANIFTKNQTAKSQLFSTITSGQYQALNSIDEFMQGKSSVSCAQLCNVQPPATVDATKLSAWIKPQTALLRLFTQPTPSSGEQSSSSPGSSTTTTSANLSSYFSILLNLQSQNSSNSALQAALNTLQPTQNTLFQKALNTTSAAHFTLSSLDQPTKTALLNILTTYQTQLTAQPHQQPVALNDPNEQAISTVANVIGQTNAYLGMRGAFFSVLNLYLAFFNQYCQTLSAIANDPQNPSYLGLTQFSTYAHNIQQALQYDGSPNSLANLINQMNPPLFFYDPTTLQSLRILPKLALLVAGSSVAPLPTFGIKQALFGTAIDPLTNQPTSNTASIGTSFSYQKFFFLQAPDPSTLQGLTQTQQIALEQAAATTELCAGGSKSSISLPSWITAVTVPVQGGGTTTLYIPNTIPSDGITGFYLNIPVFQPDPNNANNALISLFEQPVIAQPLWLSKSGVESGSPQTGVASQSQAGIITMLRGCLGDFASILALDIFDPCLTIIFQKALDVAPITGFSAAQTQSGTPVQKPTQATPIKQPTPMRAPVQPVAPIIPTVITRQKTTPPAKTPVKKTTPPKGKK